MLCNDINPFDQDLGFIREYFQDLPGLLRVLIVSGDNDYAVTFLDIKLGFESVAHFILFFLRQNGEFCFASPVFVESNLRRKTAFCLPFGRQACGLSGHGF
jgi:hypothetical protein